MLVLGAVLWYCCWMKICSCIVLALGFAGVLPVDAASSVPPKTLPGGWVYVWGDEFNGNKLDLKKWRPELGVIRNRTAAQTYTDRSKNLRVEKGKLILEAHHETFPNVNYDPKGKGWIAERKACEYTSGSVTTQGVKMFLYGRFEFRAKIPTGKGVWPAIWTMNVNKWGWPANGEIDILEHISQEPNTCYTIFRWGKDGGSKEQKVIRTTKLPDYSKDFHLYVMEWSPEAMSVSIDGKEVGSIKLDQANYPEGGNPLRTPLYLIMNTALGGGWAEAPVAKDYPAKFEIDYVRYYQKKEYDKAAKETDPQTGLPKAK